MHRRQFITAASAATIAASTPGWLAAKPRQPLKILLLGGTRFIGVHITELALARGHTITFFNRGRTRAELFPQVEKLHGDRDGCLDLIMSTLVGPRLGLDRLSFVYDYPASQAALARTRGPVASRFEAYLDGLELANGFHELADSDEQRARFTQDLAERARRQLPAMPMDEHFLGALRHGLPDCSGVALGFDRLVMCAVGARHIREVLAFGFERA